MNNRGFTLIELIVTIALLAIISTISVSVIGNIRSKHNVNTYYELLDNVVSAAKLYVTDNRYNLSSISGEDSVSCPAATHDNTNPSFSFYISLATLVSNGYLTTDNGTIKNYDGNDLILSENKVTVTFNCTTKSFDYKIESDNNDYNDYNVICKKSYEDKLNASGDVRQNEVCK